MKAEVVGCVARRVDRLDLEAPARELAAMLQRNVEIHRNDETSPVRPYCIRTWVGQTAGHAADESACALANRCNGAAMVGVAMSDENVGYPLARQRLQQYIELIAACRPRIGDRDLPFPDHVKVRALEGERARIAANDSPQAGRYLLQHAILEHHLAGKWRRLSIFAAQGCLFAR